MSIIHTIQKWFVRKDERTEVVDETKIIAAELAAKLEGIITEIPFEDNLRDVYAKMLECHGDIIALADLAGVCTSSTCKETAKQLLLAFTPARAEKDFDALAVFEIRNLQSALLQMVQRISNNHIPQEDFWGIFRHAGQEIFLAYMATIGMLTHLAVRQRIES